MSCSSEHAQCLYDSPHAHDKGTFKSGPVRKETDCERELGLESLAGARLEWHMHFADFMV